MNKTDEIKTRIDINIKDNYTILIINNNIPAIIPNNEQIINVIRLINQPGKRVIHTHDLRTENNEKLSYTIEI